MTVTVDETVDVTGSPRLEIDIDPADWGEKWAASESGGGTVSLTCAHEVVEPSESTQGIAVLASTPLNGGTIRSAATAADAGAGARGARPRPPPQVDWQKVKVSCGG